MRTAFPILAFIPVILLIAFGFMIFACPPCSGETPQTDGRESDTSLRTGFCRRIRII